MKKILSSIYLLISIILISYTFYKSEIFWEGNKRDYYLIYYITSVLLLIYSFLTFFIKKQINNYLQIIMLSTIFSFYIFEAYLTLKYEDKNGNFKISGNVFIDINEKKKFINQKLEKIMTQGLGLKYIMI